jgi:phosphate transport system substrate-binding protein
MDLAADTDFRVSLTNAPGADAYPISSLTWLLVHRQDTTSARQRAIRGFLIWMLQPEPQRMAADLHYGPLPVGLIELVRRRLRAS